MQAINSVIKREVKSIVISILIGIALTAGITTKAYADKISEGISKKFIRFHVIANSDNEFDQALKLKVRDRVLEELESELEACETIEETREMLNGSLSRIEQISEEVVRSEGYDYAVKATVENILFPTREYGDVVLAAGMYEALRIEIGDGKGKNWWCVVYPPLCYVDAAKGSISEKTKQELKRSLTDDEYELVVLDETISVKIKFKIVELWQERKLLAEREDVGKQKAAKRQVLNSL